MEDAGRDIDHLAGGDGLALFSETHFTGAFDDEIHLFLFLIVPWHLSAIWVEGYIAHREVSWLDGRRASGEILREAFRRVAAARYFGKIGDEHGNE